MGVVDCEREGELDSVELPDGERENCGEMDMAALIEGEREGEGEEESVAMLAVAACDSSEGRDENVLEELGVAAIEEEGDSAGVVDALDGAEHVGLALDEGGCEAAVGAGEGLSGDERVELVLGVCATEPDREPVPQRLGEGVPDPVRDGVLLVLGEIDWVRERACVTVAGQVPSIELAGDGVIAALRDPPRMGRSSTPCTKNGAKLAFADDNVHEAPLVVVAYAPAYVSWPMFEGGGVVNEYIVMVVPVVAYGAMR